MRSRWHLPWTLGVQAAILGLFLALGLHPRPFQAQAAYRRGLRLLAEQPAAALPDLLTAHRAWPERADIALQTAEAAWAAGQPHLTLALLRHAATLAPLPAWAYARLSAAYQAVGQPHEALQALQQGLAVYPHHPDLLQRVALLAQAQGEDDVALTALQDWVAQGQASAADRWRLALLWAARDPAAALPYLRGLADDPTYGSRARDLADGLTLALREPTHARQLILAGEALLAQGEPHLAETALRRAVALAPAEPTAWAYLGAALEAQGQDGLRLLRRAHQLAPQAALPNLLLGQYWLRRDQPERALPWIQAAIRADPQAPLPYLLQAQALGLLVGNLPRAATALRKAVQTAPHDAHVAQQAAALALRLHLPPQTTLPLARHAAALAPQDPQATLLLAQALAQAQDLITAERLLRQVLRRDPGNAWAHFYLGLILTQRGRSEGREHLQWAWRLAPPQSLLAAQAARALATP